jgi:hypothetical protein
LAGERVEKDMIAVKIGPELLMLVAGPPGHLERKPKPVTPHDLTQHTCIDLRLPTLRGLYAWEFERGCSSMHSDVASEHATWRPRRERRCNSC